MKGIINLYKPKGITSSDAVVKTKRILHTSAVGHMGTLDPMGEGVLLLGVGKATRLFDYFLGKDKVYEADFAFGYETDTLDATGTVTRTSAIIPAECEIRAVLPSLTGKISQIPPLYSAKSVDGVRAYKLARQGIAVELKPAEVEIYGIELINAAPPVFRFRIHCSSGTYIRSICRDLAEALGSAATMTAITRTRCGRYDAKDAVTLDTLSQDSLISVEDALAGLPKLELPPQYRQSLDNGVKIQYDGAPKGDFALYCEGILYGIAVYESRIKIKTYLKD